MIKKIATLAVLLNIAPIAIYAAPLDPDHFKAGTWQGVYSSMGGCSSNYFGKAVLTIANPIYTSPSDSDHYSKVSFTGTLQLQGPLPKGFPAQSDLSDDSSIYRPIPNQGNKFEVRLYSTDLYTTFYGQAGYNPLTQNIQATGSSMNSFGCNIHINVYPTN